MSLEPVQVLRRLVNRPVQAVLSALLAGSLLVVPGAASAQSSDPVAATELFLRGRDATKNEDYETACALFAESLRLDLKVGTLLNLAVCQERVGRLAEALQHWKQAVQVGTATNDRRVREARRRLAALEPRVPKLTVRLSPNAPSSATITRDEVTFAQPSLGVSLPINPGEHVIEVRAPGRKSRRFAFSIREGESKELMVEPGPEIPDSASTPPPVTPVAAPPPGPTPEPPPSQDNSLAYVLGGVGIAGVLVGSLTGSMLMNRNKTIDNECGANNQCTPAGLDAVDEAKTLLPISNVAWVVGVAGLGAGTYLLLTSGPPTLSDETRHGLKRPQGLGFQVMGKL